jgi:hypothetical protein
MRGISLLRGLGLAGALVLATGCLKIDQTLTIRADGSGDFRIAYSMTEHALTEIAAMRQLAANLDQAAGKPAGEADKDLVNPFVFDEQAVRNLVAQYEKDGIRLKSLRTGTREGWRFVDLNVSFERLEALARTPLMHNKTFTLTRTKNNDYLLVQKMWTAGAAAELRGVDIEKDLTPILAGLGLATRINTPGAIVNANSPTWSRNTVSWDVEFEKNPQMFLKFAEDGMYVVFDGTGLNLSDINVGDSSGGEGGNPAALAGP